ncbi:hypothetical protein AB0C51_07295 [Streptomyces pathocidini]|uniref:hypothetical protein n=1 Tax=Streptomyces pathocidini TaxID=1650571 RepID=UPI000AEAA537
MGELVLDARLGRLGIVMDAQGGSLFLRRPEGGREWEVAPEDVRPAPAERRAQWRAARGASTNGASANGASRRAS